MVTQNHETTIIFHSTGEREDKQNTAWLYIVIVIILRSNEDAPLTQNNSWGKPSQENTTHNGYQNHRNKTRIFIQPIHFIQHVLL